VQSANLKYSKTPTPPLALTVQNTFTQYTQVHYNGGTSISYRVRYKGVAQYTHTHTHNTHTLRLLHSRHSLSFRTFHSTFTPFLRYLLQLRTFYSTFTPFLRYLLQQQPAFALSTQLSHLFSAICFNSSQPSHFLLNFHTFSPLSASTAASLRTFSSLSASTAASKHTFYTTELASIGRRTPNLRPFFARTSPEVKDNTPEHVLNIMTVHCPTPEPLCTANFKQHWTQDLTSCDLSSSPNSSCNRLERPSSTVNTYSPLHENLKCNFSDYLETSLAHFLAN
jgi:hypothetical protein